LKLAQQLFGAPILFACLSAASVRGVQDETRPIADHHQHLYSPVIAPAARIEPITAADLIALLDAAGIRRAAVLSQAYAFGNPNRTPQVQNERARVVEENDWTSHEVGRFPDRLVGFCGVSPLRDYALEEIARCARDPHLRTGLKLHFANSDVDVENPQHVERLRAVFHAANENRMAIVVHLRSNLSRQRPYGAAQARAFLDNVLPSAPNIVVQIAHLAGAGGYDDPAVMIPQSMRHSVFTPTSSPPAIREWRTSTSKCLASLESANGAARPTASRRASGNSGSLEFFMAPTAPSVPAGNPRKPGRRSANCRCRGRSSAP
jgi:predicted TIM-barrel fold metal-dependent hydrolase